MTPHPGNLDNVLQDQREQGGIRPFPSRYEQARRADRAKPLQSPNKWGAQPLDTSSKAHLTTKLQSANKNIFKAVLSLASANLLVRVMGLLNIVVVSARFGQGMEMDAYFITSTVPTLLAQLLAGALEASIIPVYTRVRAQERREGATRLFSTLLNLLFLALTLLLVSMFVFRENLLRVSAPGASPDALALTVRLAPLVFPVLFFMLISSFLECILNTEGKFGWPAYAGVLVPMTTATVVVLSGHARGAFAGIDALCLGTLVGQVLQLVVILIRAHHIGLTYRPVLDLTNRHIRAVFHAAWPALFAGLIGLASPLVDQIFASYQSRGTISVINNALKLNSVPTGVIFAATGRAILPYLAAHAALSDLSGFKRTLRLYVWGIFSTTFLLALGMVIFAHPLITLLFRRGAFSQADVEHTAITLQGFALGLAPMSVGYITSKAFSALGKTSVLLCVSTFSVFANAAFDSIFGRLWGSFGIAFATSLVYLCTVTILLTTMRLCIGRLSLLTPPVEVVQALHVLHKHTHILHTHLFRHGQRRKERALMFRDSSNDRKLADYSHYSNYRLKRATPGRFVARGLCIAALFAAGIVGSALNATMALRVALGSLLVLAFLRYRYTLLLTWVLANAFIGSTVAFFNGNNFLTALTVPTLLLLCLLPTGWAMQRMPALVPFLALLLWMLASCWRSDLTPLAFVISWTTRLDFFAVAILAILLVNSRKRLLLLLDAMLLPALVIAVYGIWGYFTRQNGVVDPTTGYFRTASLFGDVPTSLALYLAMLIPLLLFRLFTLRGWRLWLGWGVLGIFLAALGLTFDRSILATLPLEGLLILPLLPTRRFKVALLSTGLVIGILVLLVANFLHVEIFARFLNPDVGSLNGRTYLWQAVLDHFEPIRLLGAGFQASDTLLAQLRVGFRGGVIATASHNVYLEILYDHGLIGLALLLVTLLVLLGSLLLRWQHAQRQQRLFIAMALWAALTVIIQCFVSNNIWDSSIGIYFFLFQALAFATCWEKACV